MARPTKYNDEIIDKCNDYLASCYSDDKLPTIEGLSLALEVTRPTLYDWASQEDKAEFSYTLEKIKATQADSLIQKALKGDYNAAIAKLMLHNHNYSDKQQTALTGGDGGAVQIDNYLQIEVVDSED